MDIDYLELTDTGVYECFTPGGLSRRFYLLVKNHDEKEEDAKVYTTALPINDAHEVHDENSIEEADDGEEGGAVIFQQGRPQRPLVNHKMDTKLAADENSTVGEGRGVEIVKEEGEDVELVCGLTKDFDDIKWVKKNNDVIP